MIETSWNSKLNVIMLTMAVNGLVSYVHFTNIPGTVTTHSFPAPVSVRTGTIFCIRTWSSTKWSVQDGSMFAHTVERVADMKRTTTYLEVCPLMKIPCTNEGCLKCVERRAIRKHLEESCPFHKAPCRYACIGCNITVLRKHLEEHEHDREQHLELAIKAMPKHKKTLHTIKSTLDNFNLPGLRHDVAKIDKALQGLQLFVEYHTNKLARLQSIIYTCPEKKESSELKLKLEQ